jgi:hypothetical protein
MAPPISAPLRTPLAPEVLPPRAAPTAAPMPVPMAVRRWVSSMPAQPATSSAVATAATTAWRAPAPRRPIFRDAPCSPCAGIATVWADIITALAGCSTNFDMLFTPWDLIMSAKARKPHRPGVRPA